MALSFSSSGGPLTLIVPVYTGLERAPVLPLTHTMVTGRVPAAPRPAASASALRLVKIYMMLPHTPIWENFFFGISSLGLYLHMDGNLQAYDIFLLIILNLHHTT